MSQSGNPRIVSLEDLRKKPMPPPPETPQFRKGQCLATMQDILAAKVNMDDWKIAYQLKGTSMYLLVPKSAREKIAQTLNEEFDIVTDVTFGMG